MSQVDLPRLIEPEALAEHVAARHDDTLLIVDLSREEVYRNGHISGAIHVDPTALISGIRPAVGKLPSNERLIALCKHIGLTKDSWVVACDDEGGGWAGRLIWTLEVMGHYGWSYLNGGMVAWHDAGLPLTVPSPSIPSPSSTPLPSANTANAFHIDFRSEPRIEIDELLRRHADPDVVIWDARSPAEYRGERAAANRAGRIPGAVNLDWLELMDAGRALRLRQDLPTLLATRGITPDKEVITHCQTHHRSGLSYLVARLLDFPRIRAYDGSWSEWGNRDDTPILSGPDPLTPSPLTPSPLTPSPLKKADQS